MRTRLLLAGALLLAISVATAASPADIQNAYGTAARQANPGFTGFSASRGEQFFKTTHGAEWSCSTCHGDAPIAPGKHAKTGKSITALAPSADPQRFSDAARVEKWFRRNCNDVAGRECTVVEKGDVMAFLMRFGK